MLVDIFLEFLLSNLPGGIALILILGVLGFVSLKVAGDNWKDGVGWFKYTFLIAGIIILIGVLVFGIGAFIRYSDKYDSNEISELNESIEEKEPRIEPQITDQPATLTPMPSSTPTSEKMPIDIGSSTVTNIAIVSLWILVLVIIGNFLKNMQANKRQPDIQKIYTWLFLVQLQVILLLIVLIFRAIE